MQTDDHDRPTVQQSLDVLIEAVGRASDDLRAARGTLESARADIASRNTSIARDVIADAERVVDRLKTVDEGLCDVLRDLADRD